MKIVFDLTRGVLALEGDSPDLMELLKLARELAPKLSEIRILTASAALQGPGADEKIGGEGGSGPVGDGERAGQRQASPLLREFARSIGPTNLTERIVAIAAYQERHANRGEFSAKDMGEWFTICGFQKPAQMPVALFDAKRKYGFLEKAGHGRWKLSTAGENLVTRRLEQV